MLKAQTPPQEAAGGKEHGPQQQQPQQAQEGKKAEGGAEMQGEESALYRSDEFRMYCFKVLPCSKRYCHDWTTCPFAHPGEKAKRRDPRVYTYTGVACPEMKKSLQCPRGENCPYAHNVFEYWLHPSRYRTQLCNDGVQCRRKICFFAHTLEELRVSSVKVLPADGKGGAAAHDQGFELDPFRPEGGGGGGGRRGRASLSGASSTTSGPGSSSPVSPLSPDLFEHTRQNAGGGGGGRRNNNGGNGKQQAQHSSSGAQGNGNGAGQQQQDAAAAALRAAAAQWPQQAGKTTAAASAAAAAAHMAALMQAQSDLAPYLGLGLTDAQLQQLAAVQAQAQVQAQIAAAAQVASMQQAQAAAAAAAAAAVVQQQRCQQAGGAAGSVEQLAHSLATLQLASSMPNQSISDVVNAVVQQMVAYGAIGGGAGGPANRASQPGGPMQAPPNPFAAFATGPGGLYCGGAPPPSPNGFGAMSRAHSSPGDVLNGAASGLPAFLAGPGTASGLAPGRSSPPDALGLLSSNGHPGLRPMGPPPPLMPHHAAAGSGGAPPPHLPLMPQQHQQHYDGGAFGLGAYRSGSGGTASHCGSATPPICGGDGPTPFGEYTSRSSFESSHSDVADAALACGGGACAPMGANSISGDGGQGRLLSAFPGATGGLGSPGGAPGPARRSTSGFGGCDFVPELFAERDRLFGGLHAPASAGINSPFHL